MAVLIRLIDVFMVRVWGDNGFVEDYTAAVRGRSAGALHLITFNAGGQAQHIAACYRPLSSAVFFARLLCERFTGTPDARHFLAVEAEQAWPRS